MGYLRAVGQGGIAKNALFPSISPIPPLFPLVLSLLLVLLV